MTWTRMEEAQTNPPNKPFSRSFPPVSGDLQGAMDQYLLSRDLSAKLAGGQGNRWYPSRYVDGWGRVVIPCTSNQPGNMYWQARLLEPLQAPPGPLQETLAARTGLGMPRRWESPHGVSRGDAVCVVWPLRRNRHAIVVEGPMDALAAADCGYIGVGLLSATPSEECLRLTAKLLHGIMTLAVMDIGAEEPMIFNAGWLRERGVPCRLVNPYPYKDLAACPAAKRDAFLSSWA